MVIDITVLSGDETSLFAAGELARYLRLISATPVACRIRHANTEPTGPGFTLAVAGSPGLAGRGGSPTRRKEDLAPSPDDAVSIDVRGTSGLLIGSNKRSLLLAVYRFLHHVGCRWVRPGPDGELLPSLELANISVQCVERASLRHRTICIEGAVSQDNVLTIIDWAPKVGFNGYFVQFVDGYVFYARWYQHAANPLRPAQPFPPAAARAFTIQVEQELQKRSLDYQAVGHSWTCQALGHHVSHWDPFYAPLTPDKQGMLAEVRGRRAYQWDRPMITSLCFSQHEVRTRMIAAIRDHAVAHPQVDLLHVWIDDGGGNKCECPECAKNLPADLYVQMLHELDAALTAAHCPTRIIFISYSDLLWPPQKTAKPLNLERFVFLYANSRTSYRESLAQVVGTNPPVPPFELNKTGPSGSLPEFQAFLQSWRKFFDGDSMLFEYYLAGYRNIFLHYPIARTIHEDIRHLKALGLNGLVTCQPQRTFFPTGLPLYTMGQSLWNADLDFDALIDDYFFAACGPDSALAKEFVKVTCEQLNRILSFSSRLTLAPDAAMQTAKLQRMLEEFARVLQRNSARPSLCHAQSWYYLDWHCQLLTRLVGLFQTMRAGNPAANLEAWNQVRTFLWSNEQHYQMVFDVWDFTAGMDRYFVNGQASVAPQAVVQ